MTKHHEYHHEYRCATTEEIANAYSDAIQHGWQLWFRHWPYEVPNSTTENGVTYRQYGRSMLGIIDGKPYVTHHGELEEATATVLTQGDKKIVFDLRLKGLPVVRPGSHLGRNLNQVL